MAQPNEAAQASIEAPSLVTGSDGRARCWWSGTDSEYQRYHDEEWGTPSDDSRRLFEKLCLEGFQAGLSWLTILRRREAFRRAFADFDVTMVAAMSDDDVERLAADATIIRNRAKIRATIQNARAVLELDRPLADLLWAHAPSVRPRPRSRAEVPAHTPESQALADELKRRGFRFVGPTTVYALMQAMGMVDDHLAGCWRAASAQT